MDIEQFMITFILIVGWPVLLLMTYLIINKGQAFQSKLKDTDLGTLIKPTIFGWLFGMYALGIVATAYMLDLAWYFTVIPAFSVFMIAVVIVYKAMSKWEKQAEDLKAFYKNLEELVDKRTKELEVSHQKAIKHEKELQKLKDQFVFIAAHELKTPVTAIRWGIEAALEESKEDLSPDMVEYLNNVQDSNMRLINLVNDLLNVARVDVGTIKIKKEKIDMDDLIKKTIKEMKTVFAEKSIKTNYVHEGKIPLQADKDRLKQVFINLFSNATKYNKDKGEIWVKVDEKKDSVKVSIVDSGFGITEKDQKKLFKKFGRIENSETQNIDGTGLGLYLCKEIIEKMGGEIGLESEHGKGSTFWFTLPLGQ